MLILVFLLSTCVLIEAWSAPPLKTQLKSIKGYTPDPHLTLRDNIVRFMKQLKWNVDGFRRQNTQRSANHKLRQLDMSKSNIDDISKTTASKPEQTEVAAAEGELRTSLASRASALEDKPYVEKKGLNDFLVIGDPQDPTGKMIPNDIYYNIEKGCVNWLDNCNQKGVKATLLQRITGPYKK